MGWITLLFTRNSFGKRAAWLPPCRKSFTAYSRLFLGKDIAHSLRRICIYAARVKSSGGLLANSSVLASSAKGSGDVQAGAD